MNSFISQFIYDIKNADAIEIIAVFFGIISVWFSKKENILVFPTGIINTFLFSYLYIIKTGLYADGLVNIYYTIMSIIGWHMWQNSNKNYGLKISTNSKADWLKTISLGLFWFLTLYSCLVYILPIYFSKYLTPSTVPFLDSLNAALAFTAMWLMNKKKIEHWLFWTVVNIISIPLNAYKNLAFTSVQYVVFLILGIAGFIAWHKKYKYEKN